METGPVIDVQPLGFPWPTADPFLVCVHHVDRYPAGDERMGPAASLSGRDLGQDFAGKDGWRMYHGEHVPGFPHHPHRGFETVTIVLEGFIDHTDSLGAAARFGAGDVQWLTAGRGIEHAEMFPLVHRDRQNPLELFQIWLNLPPESKMAEPHFVMMWRKDIPRRIERDEAGRTIEILMVAGAPGDAHAPAPPPESWASRADAHVAIWVVRMAPGARWTLPAAAPGVNRTLFFHRGEALQVGTTPVRPDHAITLRPEHEAPLVNGEHPAQLLLLQGRPIGRPVAQHGPFVMNTMDEVREAFMDYRRTGFGGWPWPDAGPVHPREEGPFARYSDGRIERP